jgi:hypothetical protein
VLVPWRARGEWNGELGALGFELSSVQPEQIAKPVEINEDLRVLELAALVQGPTQTFGATCDRAGKVEGGGIESGTRDRPVAVLGLCGLEFFDPTIELGDGFDLDAWEPVAGVSIQVVRMGREFPHEGDEIALDDDDLVANRAGSGGGPGDPEGGVEFVNGSVRFDAGMGFWDAAVVHQTGCAGVAGSGGNAHGQVLRRFRAMHGSLQSPGAGRERTGAKVTHRDGDATWEAKGFCVTRLRVWIIKAAGR